LRRKLLSAEEAKTLPKVLIVVHFTGMPCDMREIRELTDNHGIKVIEDASHAIGARYENAPIGKCEYSDATVFSFHPVKIITTGEGGILLTNDQALYAKAETLRSHGITKDPANFEFHDQGPWWYEQKELGYNYRMTDIQAALGISQMERLEKYIERRNSLARRYDENLAELEIQLPWNNPSRKSSYHLYTIRLSARKHKRSRAEIYDLLREFGVGTQVHYIPIHIQPYYRKLGFRPEQFPESMAFYNEAITIPLFGSMSLDQQDKVVLALKEALS
jgi:dTDP-4-amino-4,6-dideoxygalactose transaminase